MAGQISAPGERAIVEIAPCLVPFHPMKRRNGTEQRTRTSDGRFAREGGAPRRRLSNRHAAVTAATPAAAQVSMPSALLECKDPQALIEERYASYPGLKQARSALKERPSGGQAQTAAARALCASGHSPRASILAAALGPLPAA